ncbi:short-chain dehydrogenase [Flavobacteriaceae bacterium]|jgi:membrane protein YqaA with SNARE-associated domain|nr:short-chain dehydrogenase [Flavobacteriaceae bacterium]MDB2417810.1 short-chain dehydrogenase [Flavobacteriaceae bacterium]MDG1161755.1 short-chain dehydrogenase [Flavobacteriaceae bacterium]MDG1980316.1 short-chain dehydrogenase [Flavobacteriaceae bacterium]|tara:strand:- start:197 stop:802 length:606 start_codon:yes stop_codon:yes gene_type:complete
MKRRKSKTKLLHQYYRYTGFYTFIGNSLKKSAIPVILIIFGLYLVNEFVFTIDDGLEFLTQTFSRTGVLIVFFISETLLGLIPPEIFIGWSKKTTTPILNLSILATLSYTGGILSYFIGKTIQKINTVKNYLEIKMAKHLKNTGKWGGFLILIGALLPVPFSITCVAAGMIKYPLKGVVLFGLFRFVRFALYAWAIFNVVN